MNKKWNIRIKQLREQCKTPEAFKAGLRQLIGMAPTTPAGSTFVEMASSCPEAKQQREALASLGVHPVCWEQDHEAARVTYCIPPGIALSPQA